jgi:hypothetical protein
VPNLAHQHKSLYLIVEESLRDSSLLPAQKILAALGTVKQSLGNTGWVKAAVNWSGRLEKCFNSQANNEASAESCTGFQGLNHVSGITLTFPFRVDNRFILITAESSSSNGNQGRIVSYRPTPGFSNTITVTTYDEKGNRASANFTVLVF